MLDKLALDAGPLLRKLLAGFVADGLAELEVLQGQQGGRGRRERQRSTGQPQVL
jgi:hypothetical protein